MNFQFPQISYFTNFQKGSILAELLLAIAVLVVVGAFGAQFVSVSLISGESAKERGAGVRLAEEGLDAVRAISQGNNAASQGWNRMYRPPDGTGDPSTAKGAANPYHPEISGSPEQWGLVAGTETITLENETYTRKIVIDNASRDVSANIEGTYNASNDDPGTQKITVTVSKSGIADVVLTEYITRFLNESSPHSDWSGASDCGPVSATSSPATYCSGTCVDRTGTPGSVKLATSC